MPITSQQHAKTVARIGALRIGAFRIGFTPKDTKHPTNIGQPGPLYSWSRVYPASTAWTTTKT